MKILLISIILSFGANEPPETFKPAKCIINGMILKDRVKVKIHPKKIVLKTKANIPKVFHLDREYIDSHQLFMTSDFQTVKIKRGDKDKVKIILIQGDREILLLK